MVTEASMIPTRTYLFPVSPPVNQLRTFFRETHPLPPVVFHIVPPDGGCMPDCGHGDWLLTKVRSIDPNERQKEQTSRRTPPGSRVLENKDRL